MILPVLFKIPFSLTTYLSFNHERKTHPAAKGSSEMGERSSTVPRKIQLQLGRGAEELGSSNMAKRKISLRSLKKHPLTPLLFNDVIYSAEHQGQRVW